MIYYHSVKIKFSIVNACEARHQLKHGIKRENIVGRRLCVTIRDLSESFQLEQPEIAAKIKELAAIRFYKFSKSLNF